MISLDLVNNPRLIDLYKQGRTAEATLKTIGIYLLGMGLGALIVLGLLVFVAALTGPVMYWLVQLVGCPYVWP